MRPHWVRRGKVQSLQEMRLNSVLLHPPCVVLPWRSTSYRLQPWAETQQVPTGEKVLACALACACVWVHMCTSDASCCAAACWQAASVPACSLPALLLALSKSQSHTSTKCEFVAPHCTWCIDADGEVVNPKLCADAFGCDRKWQLWLSSF